MVRKLNTAKVSDHELWQRLESDDQTAYLEIFERKWEKLYHLAFSIIKDKALSEDVTQEVLLDLWERRNKVPNKDHLNGFLSQAIKFKVFKKLKQKGYSELNEEIIENLSDYSTADELLIAEEMRIKVNFILDELPQRCKEIYVKSKLEAVPNKKIAEELNISQRTVENQISKASKHLRSRLSPTL